MFQALPHTLARRDSHTQREQQRVITAQRCHVLKAKMVMRVDVQEQEMPVPIDPSSQQHASWLQRFHVYW